MEALTVRIIEIVTGVQTADQLFDDRGPLVGWKLQGVGDDPGGIGSHEKSVGPARRADKQARSVGIGQTAWATVVRHLSTEERPHRIVLVLLDLDAQFSFTLTRAPVES